MKKILLSVISGLMIMGSAIAVPTPEQRRELCLNHTDKYVWVGKTEACVPIDVCDSGNSDIMRAYCIVKVLPLERDKFELVINKYVENVLKTSVSSINIVKQVESHGVGRLGVETTDGGYFVISYGDESFSSENVVDRVWTATELAFFCYGYSFAGVDFDFDALKSLYSAMVKNETECNEIASFAVLLADADIEHTYDAGKCVLIGAI